jgi:hypothetical protein
MSMGINASRLTFLSVVNVVLEWIHLLPFFSQRKETRLEVGVQVHLIAGKDQPQAEVSQI